MSHQHLQEVVQVIHNTPVHTRPPGARTITFDGHATAYNLDLGTAAISFAYNPNVAGISGSLGSIFSTLSSGAQRQPRFCRTFYNNTNLTGSIPATLFSGISGAPAERMFDATFLGCSGLTGSIPATLFSGISGAPTRNMFLQTFSGCSGLTGPIPETLFSGIFGAPAQEMFSHTFYNCSGLTGSIPATLFSGISGAPAHRMFSDTFGGCSGLTGSIPATLFSGISGAPAQYMFAGTFSGCSGLTGYVTGGTFPDNGTAAPGGYDQTFLNATGMTSTCPAGMYDKKPTGATWSSPAVCWQCPAENVTLSSNTGIMHFNGEDTEDLVFYVTYSGAGTVEPHVVQQRHMIEATTDEPTIDTATGQTIVPVRVKYVGAATRESGSARVEISVIGNACHSTTETYTYTVYVVDVPCCVEGYANNLSYTYDGQSHTCDGAVTTIPADATIKYLILSDGETNCPLPENNAQVIEANAARYSLDSVPDLTEPGSMTICYYATAPYYLGGNWGVYTCAVTSCKYTLNLDAQGGNIAGGAATQELDYGVTYPLPTPTRPGYEFAGWSTQQNDANGMHIISAVVAGTTNGLTTCGDTLTLYAIWEPCAYTVSFDANGGTGTMPDVVFAVDGTGVLPQNQFTNPGYVFIGWNTSPNVNGPIYQPGRVMIDAADDCYDTAIMYAIWEPCAYTLILNPNGGVIDPEHGTQNLTTGQSAVLEPMTRPGYEFAGWSTQQNDADGMHIISAAVAGTTNGLTKCGDTLTLYAQWKPCVYTVAFFANAPTGATPTGRMTSQRCEFGTPKQLKPNAFGVSGYTFVGWNTMPDGSGTSYSDMEYVMDLVHNCNDDIALYAQWQNCTYRVTFNANGGTGKMPDQRFSFGVADDLATNRFTRAGYIFTGWQPSSANNRPGHLIEDGASVINLTGTCNGTVRLDAVWKQCKNTVTFNANGGTGTMGPQVFTAGTLNNHLNRNRFRRSGYTFAGWNTSANGNGHSYADGATIAELRDECGVDIDLYAMWQADTITEARVNLNRRVTAQNTTVTSLRNTARKDTTGVKVQPATTKTTGAKAQTVKKETTTKTVDVKPATGKDVATSVQAKGEENTDKGSGAGKTDDKSGAKK